MKKKLLLICFSFLMFLSVDAQTDDNINDELLEINDEGSQKVNNAYYRSSIYTLMIQNNDLLGEEIKNVFGELETPENFNNFDLGVKLLFRPSNKDIDEEELTSFLINEDVARRLVAKWFNRDKITGSFDFETLHNHASYDLSYFDIKTIEEEKGDAGKSRLMDVVQLEAMKNTYVIINDIKYIDVERKAKSATVIMNATSTAAQGISSIYSDTDLGNAALITKSLTEATAKITDMIAGMKVKITSYLFRLDWNEKYYQKMMTEYWGNNSDEINSQKEKFETSHDDFKFTDEVFVVKTQTKEINFKSGSVNQIPQDVILKTVCRRALDQNLIDLQEEFEAFRIKTPILHIIDKNSDTLLVKDILNGEVKFPEMKKKKDKIKYITAEIGMKEDINKDTEFELVCFKNNGEYENTGIIVRPIGEIWNNKYNAKEIGEENTELGYTVFEVKKGKITNENVGYLLRQVKF